MLKMNKRGQRRRMSGGMIALLVGVFAVVGLLAFALLPNLQQTQLSPEEQEDTASSTLVGKAATLSVNSRDASADDTTTRRTVPVYIQDPDGTWIHSGGTSTSTTQAQAFTDGIAVSNVPYNVLAFNATYGSVDGAVSVNVNKEAVTKDVDVYTVTDHINAQLFDKDGNALGRTQSNLTLAAGQTNNFEKLRVENNNTNTGYVLFGLYIDLAQNTNVTTATVKSGDISFENGGDSGTMSLGRTTLDDLTYKLTEPQLLFEFDTVETGSIAVQASGNDVATEAYTLYIVDGCYYFSAKGEGVKFGAETDASAPADVCASDFSLSGTFN